MRKKEVIKTGELTEKVRKSIERLKTFEPAEGYYLAFSGGKDSVVCKALLEMAGCKYDAVYRVTSVDPPELVRFIRDQHPDVIREVPRYKATGKPITMWNLIPWKMFPPTRIARYCCQYLKEDGGDGRMTVTGVRWAESVKRRKNQGPVVIHRMGEKDKTEDFRIGQRNDSLILVNDSTDSRRMIESCYKRHKTVVNPIIEWEDRDVWDFIKANGITYCDLYNQGYHRLGCIGCPIANRREREREFRDYPKYKNAYLLAFEKMLNYREQSPKGIRWRQGSTDYKGATAMDVYNWWMETKNLVGQINLFEEEGL